MNSPILPQLNDHSLESHDQHVTFCSFVGKLPATTPYPLGEGLKIVANLSHLLFFPQLSYLRGTVPTLHPVPTLASANYHLPDSCTLPEDEGAVQNGWTGGDIWCRGPIAELWIPPRTHTGQLLLDYKLVSHTPHRTLPGGTIPRHQSMEERLHVGCGTDVPRVLNLPGELFIVFRFYRRNQTNGIFGLSQKHQ